MSSRNVEIKAYLRNRDFTVKKAIELSGDTQGTELLQKDLFFNVPNGRLKLRYCEGLEPELIFYDRPNISGPKLCNYKKVPIQNGGDFELVLASALGIKVCVEKVRILYMIDQTRLHIDKVTNLGDFMELEVVLHDNQSVDEGIKIAQELLEQLGVAKSDLLTGAYADMLLEQNSSNL